MGNKKAVVFESMQLPVFFNTLLIRDVMTTTDFSSASSVAADPSLKHYYCPFCNKSLFRGKVNRLSMVCHNCNKLVVMDPNAPVKNQEAPQDDLR